MRILNYVPLWSVLGAICDSKEKEEFFPWRFIKISSRGSAHVRARKFDICWQENQEILKTLTTIFKINSLVTIELLKINSLFFSKKLCWGLGAVLLSIASLHYVFCPLVKLTLKDLAILTAFAAIFKTKTYFRWDIWGSLFIQFHFLSHIRFSLHIFLSFDYFR